MDCNQVFYWVLSSQLKFLIGPRGFFPFFIFLNSTRFQFQVDLVPGQPVESGFKTIIHSTF